VVQFVLRSAGGCGCGCGCCCFVFCSARTFSCMSALNFAARVFGHIAGLRRASNRLVKASILSCWAARLKVAAASRWRLVRASSRILCSSRIRSSFSLNPDFGGAFPVEKSCLYTSAFDKSRSAFPAVAAGFRGKLEGGGGSPALSTVNFGFSIFA